MATDSLRRGTDTTETPRTDAQVSVHDEADPSVGRTAGYNDLLDHARQLERELIALREHVEAHYKLCKGENNL